jgi:hypothetical protein
LEPERNLIRATAHPPQAERILSSFVFLEFIPIVPTATPLPSRMNYYFVSITQISKTFFSMASLQRKLKSYLISSSYTKSLFLVVLPKLIPLHKTWGKFLEKDSTNNLADKPQMCLWLIPSFYF